MECRLNISQYFTKLCSQAFLFVCVVCLVVFLFKDLIRHDLYHVIFGGTGSQLLSQVYQ